MKVLLISDCVVEHIYSSSITDRMKDIDFIISCGDLPNYYLEFIVTMLNKPLFYVKGNHSIDKVYSESGIKADLPEGCINIDQKVIEYKNIIIMGLEGSMRYNGGEYQYSDAQMSWKINRLKFKLYLNRIFKKRYVDILVTHAPPYKIHDQEDICHRGFKAFNEFIKRFKPKYLIHGHIHIYGIKNDWITEADGTKIINAYGYRVIEL
ncbi:MAG: metallophosphoesterase [Actinobacteria bacterium]|nr:metallophosphoesterase [Actinomycetota bacterium]